jgi:hypothetical protein
LNEIDLTLPFYCFSKEGPFIFKSVIEEFKTNAFSVRIPKEIKLLDEEDVRGINEMLGLNLLEVSEANRFNDEVLSVEIKSKLMAERSSRDQDFLNQEFEDFLSIDDEDKIFADKRESPRSRPKIEKWVRVRTFNSPDLHILKLFDLSRGGIGFISMNPAIFPKNSKIMIVGFENHSLDDPLIAEVLSHRPIDELEIEFKIGCKFDEGQA